MAAEEGDDALAVLHGEVEADEVGCGCRCGCWFRVASVIGHRLAQIRHRLDFVSAQTSTGLGAGRVEGWSCGRPGQAECCPTEPLMADSYGQPGAVSIQ